MVAMMAGANFVAVCTTVSDPFAMTLHRTIDAACVNSSPETELLFLLLLRI